MKRLIFLALIHCLLFTVYYSLSYSAVLLDRVVATVNNEVITWSELRRDIELESKEFLKGFTDEDREKKIKELEKSFLNSMIDLKLQLQEAHQAGLDVSPSETDSAIADIKRKYNLTDESLIESLKAEGFTLEEYRTRLAEQILLSKVVRYEVKDNILITDKEIEEYYEANKENSDFGEGNPELILMASGSEVNLIYEAAKKLAAKGLKVRAVSFPSWELFEEQDEAYREAVLPKGVRARVAVEAGAGLGWDRYVGLDGAIISLDRFGASAPAKVLFEKFGFTVENVVAKAKELLAA